MKKYFILLILLVSISLSSFAKKDINAWKNEKNMEQQYVVFKENLNFWNGSYFLSEKQLDDFYNALTDSISVLHKEIKDKANQIISLKNELSSTNNQLETAKVELDNSIKNQNAIEVFGQNIQKNIYTFIMSVIILALLVFLGILFLLFKRSSKVTARTKKDYNELKHEFEIHKKNALERYTKINMELHHTRLKLNKK
ncbi:MAG TPA: hypothetical protein VKA38_11385 [Draconibacterium sp.]|nr:hypothetical protein [Draconibacterium sp.]